jgi:outer membrane protein insertion porin family
MRKILAFVLSFSLLLATFSNAFAAPSASSGFLVKKIQVNGLQRVSRETLLHYMGVSVGRRFNYANSSKILSTLYSTDFFANIKFLRDGQTLIVNVSERPTISAVNITGNKQIPQDKLNTALEKLGLTKGRFLSHAVLSEVNQALSNQYYAMGRYNVRIAVTQEAQPRNRVAVNIAVSEGAVAKVAGIKILGNHVYDSKTLINQLALSMPSFTTFFTSKDEYSADKLQQSEQSLTNYYMDRGYIRARIDSTSVSITPDRKHVYLVFKLVEGQQYHVSGFSFEGNLAGSASALQKSVSLQKGQIFSRQVVMNDNKTMTNILGNKGYAFAQINPQPKIDDKNNSVFLNFNVTPGRKYYIRDIDFSGNSTTSQIALRKQMYQLEGSLYSTQQVYDSMYNFQQDTYLSQQPPPQINPAKVPGTNDLLDLDVKLAERLSAQFQLSIGYSEAYGFLLSTGISQSNFMGTGKTAGFSVSVSGYQKSFSFNYTNPYFTPDGVSRTISLFGSQTSSDQLSVAEYNTDAFGFNVGYGFPLSVYSSLNLGYGLTRTILRDGDRTSNIINNFIGDHGTRFDQLMLTAGWSRRTLDRPILPTKGTQQSLNFTLSAPVDTNKLEYLKVDYTHDWYQPMSRYFILHTHGIFGFGTGYGSLSELPFFQNYYAGGLGVQGINRSYTAFSLGPTDSTGNQVGGNLLTDGHVSMIFPRLFHSQTVRPSVFVDAGNVFSTYGATHTNGPDNKFRLRNIRYSVGAQVEWWTPLNLPLIFSFAEPVNKKPGDQINNFQFTIGTMY